MNIAGHSKTVGVLSGFRDPMFKRFYEGRCLTSSCFRLPCAECSTWNILPARPLQTRVRDVPRGTSAGNDRFSAIVWIRNVPCGTSVPNDATHSIDTPQCSISNVVRCHHVSPSYVQNVPRGTSASNDATRLIDWRLCSTWNIGRQRLFLREQHARCSTWNISIQRCNSLDRLMAMFHVEQFRLVV